MIKRDQEELNSSAAAATTENQADEAQARPEGSAAAQNSENADNSGVVESLQKARQDEDISVNLQ